MARRRKLPKIPEAEQKLVEACRALGYRHVLKKDSHGRDRIIVGFDGEAPEILRWTMTADGEKEARFQNIGRDPLRFLYRNGNIDHALYRAGEDFRVDYELREKSGVKGASWDTKVDGGGLGPGIADRVIEATGRLHYLEKEVGMKIGPAGWLVLVLFVGHRRGIANLARSGYGSEKELSVLVHDGLRACARFYSGSTTA